MQTLCPELFRTENSTSCDSTCGHVPLTSAWGTTWGIWAWNWKMRHHAHVMLHSRASRVKSLSRAWWFWTMVSVRFVPLMVAADHAIELPTAGVQEDYFKVFRLHPCKPSRCRVSEGMEMLFSGFNRNVLAQICAAMESHLYHIQDHSLSFSLCSEVPRVSFHFWQVS